MLRPGATQQRAGLGVANVSKQIVTGSFLSVLKGVPGVVWANLLLVSKKGYVARLRGVVIGPFVFGYLTRRRRTP